MNYFCTLFDKRYFARGLALYQSLLQQGERFHLWILCMDEETFDLLSRRNLSYITLLKLENMERANDKLILAKKNRSLVEFYFTSKAFLCLYILDSYLDVNLITYVDADIYFFGSPTIISEEMKGYSIGLSAHRFPSPHKDRDKHGLYNAGFISFRRDEDGMQCLRWWRDKCFEWCHDYLDNGRYADQLYLDHIPIIFGKVAVFKHKGLNLAPWNISQYNVIWDGNRILVDNEPLIFFHFHGMKPITPSWYDSGFWAYNTVLTKIMRIYIFIPYLNMLTNENHKNAITVHYGTIRKDSKKNEHFAFFYSIPIESLNRLKRFLKGIYFHSYIYSKEK